MKKLVALIFVGLLLGGNAWAAISLDTYASAATGLPVTISTAGTNELILLFIVTGGPGPCNAAQVSDTAGLSWITRQTQSSPIQTGEVYAIASSKLTSDVITIAGALCSSARTLAIAIAGVNTTTPFDTNGSFPAFNYASPINSISVSTNNANDMLVGNIRGSGSLATVTEPTGFTYISNAGTANQDSSYEIFSSLQSSLSVSYNWTGGGIAGFMLDAVQAASGGAAPTNAIMGTF